MKREKVNSKVNRGSSLLIVLIAMALIGILAAMVLTMSMSNLQMKQVDKGTKKNFYSAEVALDELRTGLESDVTAVVTEVYTKIMTEYAEKPVGERNEKFKEDLALALGERFDSENAITVSNYMNKDSKYSLDNLRNYLVETKDNTTVTAKDNKNTLESRYEMNDPKKQYVCFRNICLGYLEPSNQMYTQITTDIKIKIPNADFEAIGDRPTYTEYAVIASEQLLANAAQGNINGNVFAGKYGIMAKLGAVLDIKADQVIVENTITANDGGQITIDDTTPGDTLKGCNIWTDNIETTSANTESAINSYINLTGSMYVADDVTINAPYSNVVLNGSYYGYGKGNIPDESSAMIVNRKHSVLDLTSLDNLFLAGRAYIEPVKMQLENVSQSSDYILTGEAISCKGNQDAYLLPGECIGVRAGGVNAGHNPLSLDEFNAMQQEINNGTVIKEVDTDYVLSFNGEKLSEYVNAEKPFLRIFDKTNSSVLVYYYPNFKNEMKANEFFEEYCKDEESLNHILKRMGDNDSYIKLPTNITNNLENGRKTYVGNIIDYKDDASIMKLYNNSVNAQLPNRFKKESDDLETMFNAYTKKLVPSITYYPDSEKNPANMFESLIVESSGDAEHPGLTELIEGKTLGANNSVLFADSEYSSIGKFILVKNGKTTPDGEFDSVNAFTVDDTVSNDVHIIIATGDVEVKKDFEGLIISKGVIKVLNGKTITSSPQKVFDLICNSPIRTVFRDYNSFPMYLKDDDNNEINISSLIQEENWSKN